MRGMRENGDALLKACFSTRWIVPRGKVLWSKKSLLKKELQGRFDGGFIFFC